jgi:acyl-[acyl carrier protein]--UDP-N-acetylglucosamine O-acyltransferase
MEGARIGKNCVFPGAVISAVPQDLKFGGEESLAIMVITVRLENALPLTEVQSHQVKLP